MLKDITLGQYFPGNTLAHRLDPRTKLISLLLYIIAIFCCHSVWGYGAAALSLALSAAVARVGVKPLFHGLRPVLFIVVFTSVLNMLYTPGEPLVSFWVLTITRQGVVMAASMVVRITLLITGSFLLTYTTSPIQLTDGLESLLSPLKKLRVPVHELAMMMSIALRFIPTLIEEADKIMNAQKARGADFESGSLAKRARALIPLLVPLFVSAFRRADELATAMECRCYHGGEGRTRLHVLRFAARDYLTLAFFLALAAGILLFDRAPLI